MTKRLLAIATHNLNSGGGQDRSMREIAKQLQKKFRLSVYTFELENAAEFPDADLHLLRPEFRRIQTLNIIYYLCASLWMFGLRWLFRGKRRPLVLTTGASALICDVVQVQYVNKKWQALKRGIPSDICEFSRGRGKTFSARFFRFYHGVFLRFHAFTEDLVYSREKTFIAISESVSRELRELFPVKKIHVIQHGVDPQLFRPAGNIAEKNSMRARLGIAPDRIVIIFVGAFERKGLVPALNAIAAMDEKNRDSVTLLAIGAGDAEYFRGHARKLGIEKNFISLPNRSDIADCYRAADIFLLPSLYEPFGLVVTEAMASALPVVISRCVGAADLIQPGENGILVEDPLNAPALAKALESLVGDAALRTRIGLAARITAAARPWEKVAEEYAQVLNAIALGE